MHSDIFDRYHTGESRLHRLDPRVKVLAAVGFILAVVLLPDGAWLSFLLAWGMILAASLFSNLGPGFTLRRSFIALPFALAAITAIFSVPGSPLWTWQIGSLELVATTEGLLRFVSIIIRSWLSVQAAILLVAVTQFPDLIHAFEHLHVPAMLTTIVAFLYRYLFVLSDEVIRLMRAREARSATLPGQKSGGSLFWRGRIAGHMAGQLFLRSYERSDRIYNAMLARGYNGQLRTLHPHAMTRADWMAGALALTAMLMLQIIGHL